MKIRNIMLNKTRRENNKSKGPWGMKNFNIEYRKMGEKMLRHRFVSAPSQEGAEKQFAAMMDKAQCEVEILGVLEVEWEE